MANVVFRAALGLDVAQINLFVHNLNLYETKTTAQKKKQCYEQHKAFDPLPCKSNARPVSLLEAAVADKHSARLT